MPILHFTVTFDFILHFAINFWLFFILHPHKHVISTLQAYLFFPVLQPKFEHFTLYIFKKALFTALRFTYCPPLTIFCLLYFYFLFCFLLVQLWSAWDQMETSVTTWRNVTRRVTATWLYFLTP